MRYRLVRGGRTETAGETIREKDESGSVKRWNDSDNGGEAAIRADHRLMQAVADGDEDAFGRILVAEAPRLTRFVAAVLGDVGEAEEVVQEALIRLWRNAAAWEPRARIATWLHHVAYHLSIDRLRRRRPLVDIDALDDVLEDETPSPERQLTRVDDVRLVHEALDRMPDRQRTAIVLAHFQELGQADAAAVMDMSEHAYESLLARARRRLRGLLAGQRQNEGEGWS